MIDLKKYSCGKYLCDAGSVMIGGKTFVVDIPNGYGDGCFNVYVDNAKELMVYDLEHEGFNYVTMVKGRFNIYDYDCLKKEERDDDTRILAQLHGTYLVFSNYGDVLFWYLRDDE